MCGRCACARDPTEVQHACAYRPRGAKKAVKPRWVTCSPTQQKYYPSYNISPQTNTPVLVSSQHAHILKEPTGSDSLVGSEERVLQVMKWGLLPSWHKGDASSFGTVLNNCRFEGMMDKPSFRSAIQKRQRCVVLADGFFEWYRGGRQKQPYFIFFTDSSQTEETREVLSTEGGLDTVEEGAASSVVKGERSEVKGRMLTVAGLFDKWSAGANEDPLYTYTIITVESHPEFGSIHHRMPAVLEGDAAVRTWLDPSVSTHEAARLIKATTSLSWHPVSSVVNNVKNKTPECVLKIDPDIKVSSRQNTLLKWFGKPSKKSEAATESGVPKAKKAKLEEDP